MIDAKKHSPVIDGIRLGFKISLVLSSVYAVLGTLAEAGRQIWLTQDLRILILPVVMFTGWLPFVLVIGIGPAVMLGSVTGGLIGALWTFIGRWVDGWVFALAASALCASIVVLIHSIFEIPIELSIPQPQLDASELHLELLGLLVSYPFLLGVPSILYIVTGAWGSRLLWEIRRRDPIEPN